MLRVKHNNQLHGFHMVTRSPWPICAAMAAFMLTFGLALFMHGYISTFLLKTGFVLLLMVMYTWWRDIVREATYEGQHTHQVQQGLKLGMILFIVSEILFFFAFFWAFFYVSLSPSVAIGCVWPPMGLPILSAWHVPLLNTLILLTSGATITVCHFAIILGSYPIAVRFLGLTIVAAIIFMCLQGYEYVMSPFNISDSVYGSTFFMLTGFHGFHVFIGTTFLIVCLFRLQRGDFTKEHHFGFEAAAWYWHFVDVVWLFLFVTLYWWGS